MKKANILKTHAKNTKTHGRVPILEDTVSADSENNLDISDTKVKLYKIELNQDKQKELQWRKVIGYDLWESSRSPEMPIMLSKSERIHYLNVTFRMKQINSRDLCSNIDIWGGGKTCRRLITYYTNLQIKLTKK